MVKEKFDYNAVGILFYPSEVVKGFPLVNADTKIIPVYQFQGRRSRKWKYATVHGDILNWDGTRLLRASTGEFDLKLKHGKVNKEFNGKKGYFKGVQFYYHPELGKNVPQPEMYMAARSTYFDVILKASQEILMLENEVGVAP